MVGIGSVNAKYFTFFMSLVFVTQVAYYFYNSRKKPKKLNEINEVIMFSQEDLTQKRSKYAKYKITPTMDRLLYYLNKPKYSIDICMYVITHPEITNVLIKLRYRGVKIRLIIDADMAFANGSIIRKVEKQGISVRWMKSTNLMHHKFTLVDTSNLDDQQVTPFVMMGSLNWTNQALSNNWEDVTITSHPDIVQQFKLEFERLWVLFKPIVEHR